LRTSSGNGSNIGDNIVKGLDASCDFLRRHQGSIGQRAGRCLVIVVIRIVGDQVVVVVLVLHPRLLEVALCQVPGAAILH